jgi:hypothetical protein
VHLACSSGPRPFSRSSSTSGLRTPRDIRGDVSIEQHDGLGEQQATLLCAHVRHRLSGQRTVDPAVVKIGETLQRMRWC